MDQKKTVRPFSMKDKIGYTLGDLGCCFTEQYRAMYLSIFYTLILQVNPFHVGILLLITKIWDAVNDPIIGAIVDSRKATKGGKFIPWFLRGLANRIDTILIVGKGEITDNIIKQADDALTAREIIKGKVLENSAYSSREAAEAIAEKCSADVVQVIGSKFVLYRRNDDEPVIELPKAKK